MEKSDRLQIRRSDIGTPLTPCLKGFAVFGEHCIEQEYVISVHPQRRRWRHGYIGQGLPTDGIIGIVDPAGRI